MSETYVFVINSLLPGGAERSLIELLPRLMKTDVRPIVYCLYRPEISIEDEARSLGLDVRHLDATRFVGRVRELRRAIKAEAPSLIHTTLFDSDMVGRLATIGTGVPVVTTLANATYDDDRIRGDANLNPRKVAIVKLLDGFTGRHLTTHFHAVSHAVKASSVAALKLRADDVTVVHRGRDPERLGRRTGERREMVRRKLGIEEGEKLVLTVGRQEHQKGQQFLVQAMASLVDDHPAARLAIAGRPGSATPVLEGLVEELALQDRVMFLGHRSDVADLLVGADVFVFPSLWEGLGGALIEALALEVPIVASDLAALREVVEPGVNGFLVPAGDAQALATGISQALAASTNEERLVTSNRARFEANFELDDCADRMIELLSKVSR
ncbi:MAG: glycosyltransferase [Acidimicrobiia bacterium]|nr:glycosyltransferase [Acidimicrobiia bacterium]MDH3462173.1 glycosyltransferase [Acidimicrobiia bacterium]